MKKLNLIKQNHHEPNFRLLGATLKDLTDVLISGNLFGNTWQYNLDTILKFQDADGSFKLIDSFKVEADARVDFCYMPTYICTAILLKAYITSADYRLEDIEKALPSALKACCGRGLAGHGYDSLKGKLDAIEVFMKAGLREFLLYHSEICPEFTDMIMSVSEELLDHEEQRNFSSLWGEDYSVRILRINDYFNSYKVFVYGTLMQGERNHDYFLWNSKFIGNAMAEGFEMYDVGSFPAIVSGKGIVKGEIYEVPKDTLKDLDNLEGEGDLYIRICLPVISDNCAIHIALAYVYNRSTIGLEQITEEHQPYTSEWYKRI